MARPAKHLTRLGSHTVARACRGVKADEEKAAPRIGWETAVRPVLASLYCYRGNSTVAPAGAGVKARRRHVPPDATCWSSRTMVAGRS